MGRKRRNAWSAIAIALLPVALAPSPARAGTDSGTVTVTAVVPDACVITTAPLAFGNYAPLTTNAAAPLDATAAITVRCTGGSGTSVGLGDGLNGVRQMKHATLASFLSYELYQNAGRTTRWGDVVAGQQNATGFPFVLPGPLVLTIYGRVPPAQVVAAGTYSDTVSATVYF